MKINNQKFKREHTLAENFGGEKNHLVIYFSGYFKAIKISEYGGGVKVNLEGASFLCKPCADVGCSHSKMTAKGILVGLIWVIHFNSDQDPLDRPVPLLTGHLLAGDGLSHVTLPPIFPVYRFLPHSKNHHSAQGGMFKTLLTSPSDGRQI